MSRLPKTTDTGQYHQGFQAIIPGVSHRGEFSETSIVCSDFQSSTTLVRIYSTEGCWIKFGSGGSNTAVADDGISVYLPPLTYTYFGLLEGNTNLAVIRDEYNGVIHIVEAK